MAWPHTFAAQSGPIPLSQLDDNFNAISSSSGASLVGFVQTGTSAIPRSVQDKEQDGLSVLDFMTSAEISAVRTGVYGAITSVHLAIQAAINASSSERIDVSSGGRVVRFPAGQYRITTALSVPYGVSLKGDGGTESQILCYSCNGISLTASGTSIGQQFIEDIGLTGMAGNTYSAIVSPVAAPTQDGMYLRRLRIYDWNEGIALTDDWTSFIEECKIQKVNRPVRLDTVSVMVRVSDCRIVLDGGCSRGGAAPLTGIEVGLSGGVIEDIQIFDNYVIGFANTINIGTAVFVTVQDNDLAAAGTTCYGVKFNSITNVFNVIGNYIEIDGTTGIGVYAGGVGAEYHSQINIQDNNFIASGTTTSTGIQLNDSGNTNQFHSRITGNLFIGFTSNDIYLPNPAVSVIENNRCMSTAPAASILTSAASSKGAVFISKNWCNKLITNDAADIASGKVVLDHNTVSNTFTPYKGSFTPSYVPASGAFGAITYGQQSGVFERIGNLCFISGTIYTTALTVGTASGNLYIQGLPFAATNVTAISVGDCRLWPTNNPDTCHVHPTNGIYLYYRTTANGANTISQVSDMGTGAAANLVEFSGVYVCG